MQPSTEQIEAARQGDTETRDALSQWCLKHTFQLAYVDLGSIPNRIEAAEEIAGEASCKAILHLIQFQPGTHFDRWLQQIVRNCIRDHYRRLDKAVPRAIYQRWVHAFLASCGADLEAFVRQALGNEASEPHPVLLQRIAADLSRNTYRQFMSLAYEGHADVVLAEVKRRLRTFMGLEWLPLYYRNRSGDWMEASLPGGDETVAQVLQQEFIQQVNENLADLLPLCRRFLRWYYLNRLRIPEIARLEQMNERTAYRRLDHCSASFRELLLHSDYFAEFATHATAAQGGPGR